MSAALHNTLNVRAAMVYYTSQWLARSIDHTDAILDLLKVLEHKDTEFPVIMQCSGPCQYDVRCVLDHQKRAVCQFVVLMPDNKTELVWRPWPVHLAVPSKKASDQQIRELLQPEIRGSLQFTARLYPTASHACGEREYTPQGTRHCFSVGPLRRVMCVSFPHKQEVYRFCDKVDTFLRISLPNGVYSIDESIYKYEFEKVFPATFNMAMKKAHIAMEDYPKDADELQRAAFIGKKIDRVLQLLPKIHKPRLLDWAQWRGEYEFTERKRKRSEPECEVARKAIKTFY